MAGISLSGLVSGSFDWKSVVDQLIKIESVPIARLETEESKNIDQLASLEILKTNLTSLQTAAAALSADGLFNGRTATSTTLNSTWTARAAKDAPLGRYTINVQQLATAAQYTGAGSISTSLNAAATDLGTNPNGIAGLTLATLPTATAITAGESTFTINGKKITINSADSLQSVFDKILNETGVLVSYDAGTDKIKLANGGSPIILGAANDTSNFLSVMRLATKPGDIESSGALGSTSLTAALAGARLSGDIDADAEGNGSFSINGETISYNVDTDSLTAILERISDSEAGVKATYDRINDRVVLTSKATGNMGLYVEDINGSLMSALGLEEGSALTPGKDALFTVNDGDPLNPLRSSSNTLDEWALGVPGLSVTIDTEETQTINVTPATVKMRAAIESFISSFNAIQSYIDTETKIGKTADGQVSAGVLATNREIDRWTTEMRKLAFQQVSGLTGTVQRLESLGIDFDGIKPTLLIKDSAKLDAALADNTSQVAAFFTSETTGFAARFEGFLDPKLEELHGDLPEQMKALNKQNKTIEEQIATLNRRLENQRELLTSAFIAMQNVQSQAKQQQTTLTNMWDSMNRDS